MLDMTADAVARHERGQSPRPDGSSTTSTTSTPLNSLFSLPFKFMTTPTKKDRQPSPSPATAAAGTPSISAYGSGSASASATPTSSRRGSIEGVTALGTDKKNATTASSRKPSSRPKTSFVFAHPPPTSRARRLRIRPKLLLQLHQVSRTSPRPIPALDVIPSALFCPLPVKRRVSDTVRNKERPSTTDLIIVPSDRYDSMAAPDDDARSTSSQEEECREQRKVLATLRQPFREAGRVDPTVDIHRENGASWKITPLPQGGYEFSSEDEHGVSQRIRWVARTKGKVPTDDTNKRFTFSIIDPRTRRHPVIAWMTRQGIDILDQYSQSAGGDNSQAAASATATATETETVETDENLRTLIIATGIWTAFREGWSQNPLSPESPFTPTPNTPSSPHPPPSTSTSQNPQSKPTSSSNGADSKSKSKSKEKDKDRSARRSGLHSVGARFLSGGILQRSHSSTAESWKTAKSPGGLGESVSNSTTALAEEGAPASTAQTNRADRSSSNAKTDGQKQQVSNGSHTQNGRENQAPTPTPPPPAGTGAEPDSFESTRDLKAGGGDGTSNGHLAPTASSKKGLRRLSALLGKKKKPPR